MPPPLPPKPHRATVILVFGILSLCACHPFGIAAWIMGNNDLREMSLGIMDPSGRENTNVGRICGIIGTCVMAVPFLLILGWLCMMIFMLLAAAAAGAH